jgi:hypothetical protein
MSIYLVLKYLFTFSSWSLGISEIQIKLGRLSDDTECSDAFYYSLDFNLTSVYASRNQFYTFKSVSLNSFWN